MGATLAPPLTGPNISLLFDLLVARNEPHCPAFNSLKGARDTHAPWLLLSPEIRVALWHDVN